jgi:hypothetical protein
MNKPKINFVAFYIILIELLVFRFFAGVLMISYSSSIYEYPKYERYSFSFLALDDKGIVNFSQFRINYHFDVNEGTLSFIPEENISRFIIHFPKGFEIVSAEYWGEDKKEPFEFEYLNKSEEFVSITFSNKSKDEWIFVNFKAKISPNARFSIWKNSLWGGNSHFYFNMGDNFECVRQDCFFNLLNVQIDRTSLGTQQESSSSLIFTNQTTGVQSGLRHEFELSARSRNALTKKSFWLSFGVSIIVGSIFAIFSVLIAVYQDNKKYKKNKKMER